MFRYAYALLILTFHMRVRRLCSTLLCGYEARLALHRLVPAHPDSRLRCVCDLRFLESYMSVRHSTRSIRHCAYALLVCRLNCLLHRSSLRRVYALLCRRLMRPAVLCSIQAYEYDQLTLPVCKLAASASDSTLVCADAAYALEWCILDCRLCRSRMRHVHESQSLHNHRSAYALHRSRHLYAYVHLVNLSYRQALSPSHNASCNSLRRVCAL